MARATSFRSREWKRCRIDRSKFEEWIVYTVSCEPQVEESTSYSGITADRMPASKDAWMVTMKRQDDELPRDERVVVYHMLIDSGLSM